MKPKILIFTSPAGHLSTAQAAAAILKKHLFEVQTVNLFHSTPGAKIWASFYRYFPYALKTAYKIGEQEPIQASVKLYMEKTLLKQVLNDLEKERIDFKQDLSVLLPVSHQMVLRDFQSNLIREIKKFI